VPNSLDSGEIQQLTEKSLPSPETPAAEFRSESRVGAVVVVKSTNELF